MHYYQFNMGDYARDTLHLEPLEDLAYRRMIDLYYSRELPLPNDLDEIARLIRMRTHCDCIAIVLRDFFSLEGDGYHQLRIDSEIFTYREKSEKASKSAKARWNKVKEKQEVKTSSERNANALKAHSKGNANQEPLTINQEPLTKKTLAGPALEIFKYWCEAMNKNPAVAKLTTKREKAIKARLKDYTVAQIKCAIDGCSRDPFSMGQNDRQKPFNDIELICRSGEKLESFLEARVPTGQYSAVTQHNIDVLSNLDLD